MKTQEIYDQYTFADFLTWDENFRGEIVNGELIRPMSCLAVKKKASLAIATQMFVFLYGICQVVPFPRSLRPFEKDGDSPTNVDTVLTPDIIALRDESQMDDNGCKGAPYVVIEITSIESRHFDHVTKYKLYEQAGVQEYWMVDPIRQLVEVSTLTENGHLRPTELYSSKDEIAHISTLNDCPIYLDIVFGKRKK